MGLLHVALDGQFIVLGKILCEISYFFSIIKNAFPFTKPIYIKVSKNVVCSSFRSSTSNSVMIRYKDLVKLGVLYITPIVARFVF